MRGQGEKAFEVEEKAQGPVEPAEDDDGEPVEGFDLRGWAAADIQGLPRDDHGGLDLKGAILCGANLLRAQLQGANLARAQLCKGPTSKKRSCKGPTSRGRSCKGPTSVRRSCKGPTSRRRSCKGPTSIRRSCKRPTSVRRCWKRSTCLSAAFVPTGTKPGVSMTPCGVWIRPTCGDTVLGTAQCWRQCWRQAALDPSA